MPTVVSSVVSANQMCTKQAKITDTSKMAGYIFPSLDLRKQNGLYKQHYELFSPQAK